MVYASYGFAKFPCWQRKKNEATVANLMNYQSASP